MSPELKKALLWLFSALLVLGLHLGLFFWSSYWRSEPVVEASPPPALMIQLAPVPAAPKPAAPPPPVVQEPDPEPQKVVEAPKPRLEIEKPKPRPRPRPEPPKPQPPKPVEPAKPAEPAEEVAKTEQTVATSETAATPSAPVPTQHSGPSADEVRWEQMLLEHLARYRQYPHAARSRNLQGTVSVRFRVDANGRVLSYDFAQSSGHSVLDRATRQMIARAQPLPKPPASMLRNGTVEVIAPIVYNLTRH